MKQFDVVVVGGGHAGTEAAATAARCGAKTALITLDKTKLGALSCNPAIGGLGKGHLVREIDALGGVMPHLADYSGIQFRLLNRRKGPAVQGPRAQVDRLRYAEAAQRALGQQENLEIVEGEVTALKSEGGAICGVVIDGGTTIETKTVVLTTGTFLRGIVHIGDRSYPAGRMGERATVELADQIAELNLPIGRLKTGTPPRLASKTINWDGLEMQPGDEEPAFFSFTTQSVQADQVECGITHTNEKTHEIIEKNLSRSAMYGGHIDGIGPRYCPSIEDKVVRFAEKTSHQVFLEPETASGEVIYPNGISTSLPEEVQADYVRSIKGLEAVEILQPGYAIEYDYVDPRALTRDLHLSDMPGLFLAGQINGTTGYEEAAAQGLVAGLNAARRSMALDPVTFDRTTSYIGVLVDDLTLRGVSEPYRMFTSRAEYRLSLRIDNADQRLLPLGRDLGLVGDAQFRAFEDKMDAIDRANDLLSNTVVSPTQARGAGLNVNLDGVKRSMLDLLAFPTIQFSDLKALDPSLSEIPDWVAVQIAKQAMYAPYIERQQREAQVIQDDENRKIPSDFDYLSLSGVSAELCAKLQAARPETIAQAGRIEGMTPACLLLLLNASKRALTRKSA